MDKRSLVTEKPELKQKGFKQEHLRVLRPTPREEEIRRRLCALAATPASERLSAAHRGIVDTVLESYHRVASGEPLEPRHFVLGGHELLEYDLLAEADVLRYVVYRYRYNKFPDLKLVDEYPPCLQIEPTSVCNFRCVMCYQSDESFSGKRSAFMGNMTLELFRTLVDQCAGNVEAVTLASRGEPLVHPQIVEMLDYCRGKFLGFKLNTNASLLNERNIHALLSGGLQTLVFSIDATDKELYESIRVGGKFERLLKNLELYSNIRKRHYPQDRTIVRISGVKINERQDIAAMEARWCEFADSVSFTTYRPWEDTYHNPVNRIGEACTEFWRRMFVWWDGVVNPCDTDYKSTLSRWNASREGISAIWTSDAYHAFRDAHLAGRRGQLEPCQRCVVV